MLKAKIVYKKSVKQNNALLDMINKPLILAIFLGYKILNWYYSSSNNNNQNQNFIQNQNISSPFNQSVVNNRNICPLCSKDINNPAVLSCSGYVFCYNCINNFVKTHKKCPISNLSAN